ERREERAPVQVAKVKVDPNEIAAAALKARIMGDTATFQRLQQELADAKEEEERGSYAASAEIGMFWEIQKGCYQNGEVLSGFDRFETRKEEKTKKQEARNTRNGFG